MSVKTTAKVKVTFEIELMAKTNDGRDSIDISHNNTLIDAKRIAEDIAVAAAHVDYVLSVSLVHINPTLHFNVVPSDE